MRKISIVLVRFKYHLQLLTKVAIAQLLRQIINSLKNKGESSA